MFKKLMLCAVVMTASAIANAQSRIEHIGSPPLQGEITSSSVDMSTDIMTAARTIFPAMWSGFSQKQLDIRRTTRLYIRAGESWVSALERWLTQEQMTAKIDWTQRKFYLRNSSSGGMQGFGAGDIRMWSVMPNDIRLENTLERWAKESGYKLVWDADRHILISAGDQFSGTITEAINRLLSSPAIRESDYPLEAVIYNNTPPVIRITRLGDQQTKE